MYVLEQLHLVPGIYPVADFMAATVNSDVVKCESAVGMRFTIIKGVGALGTSTITIDACDDVTPTTTSAVTFQYRISTTPDTWGAWTQAAATGFTTTAGSNQAYEIFVRAADLAAVGYAYARLHAVEVVNDPVVGCVNIEVLQPRYQPVPATLLT